MLPTHLIAALLGSVSSMMLVPVAYAGPVGGNVAAGAANIQGQGSSAVTIDQSSQRVVIDWQSFDTHSNERVDFNQPNANAIALNRIQNGSPTQFNGALNANGNVVIMNGNGVVFGQSAKVDVNGIIATTSDISNEDFMQKDNLVFDKPGNGNAAIINNGHITAKESGLVGFVAPQVINNGVINAKLGKVKLASGDKFTVDLYGDGLVSIAASDAVNQQLVKNTGTIQADGGTIVMTAAQARSQVDALIINEGIIEAKTIAHKNGMVILSGGGTHSGNSSVIQNGVINTTGMKSGEKGGKVQITADTIYVGNNAVIDASGDAGGGDIKIGGDYKGSGTTPTALKTTLDTGSRILNNAVTSGNGGRTIIWADDTTEFKGTIQAKGGSESGNGGFVETSGKKNLLARGKIDLSASHGDAGTWLLDPTDITIYGRGTGGTDNVNTVTTSYLESQNAHISLLADNNIHLSMAGDTLTLGNNYNLTLTTTNGFIVADSQSNITTSGTGNITFNAGSYITWQNNSSLNASGTGSVRLNAVSGIAIQNGADIATQGGDIVLNSNRNGTGGTIQLYGSGGGSSLYSNGGQIIIGGGTDPENEYATASDTSHGLVINDGFTIDASGSAAGGDIFINGHGWANAAGQNGIYFGGSNSVVRTNFNGNITLKGMGGGITTTQYVHGIQFTNDSTLETVNGSILLKAGGLSEDATSHPFAFADGAVTTTGTGDITFESLNPTVTPNGMVVYSAGLSVTSGRDVSFVLNKFERFAPLTVNAARDIIFRPNSSGQTVGIENVGSYLNITNAMLDNLSWGGTLWIGGYGNVGDAGYISNASDVIFGSNRSFNGNVHISSAGTIINNRVISAAINKNINMTALGNVNISGGSLTATGTGAVTLRANSNIDLSGSITTAAGNITINSDRDEIGGGRIYSTSALTSTSGNIILGGGSNPETGLAQSNTTTAGITLSSTGAAFSTGGDIIINGAGWQDNSCSNNCFGVYINQGSVSTTGSGNIFITSIGGGTAATNSGHSIVLLGNANLSSVNGDITLTGKTTSTQSSAYGISSGGSTLTAAGTGNINLITNGSSANNGIQAYSATSVTSGGDITFQTDKLSTGTSLTLNAVDDIILRPYTAGKTIGVGVTSGYDLNLTPAQLARLTWGDTLWIGGYGLTGDPGYINTAGALTIGNGSHVFNGNVHMMSNNNNLVLDMNGGTASLANNSSITLTAVNASITTNSASNIVTSGTGSILFESGANLAQNINFTNAVNLTSDSGDINLKAGGSINFANAGSNLTTQGGDIILNSSRNGAGGNVSIQIGSSFVSNGGNITFGGGADPETEYAFMTNFNNGVLLLDSTVDARGTSTGGNIIMNGMVQRSAGSGKGVYLQTTTIETNRLGTITISGVNNSTGAAGNSLGIYTFYGTRILSEDGTITLNGSGGLGSGFYNVGIALSYVYNGSVDTIQSVNGDIIFNGRGGNGTYGYGFDFDAPAAAAVIATNTGDITITGTSVGGSAGIAYNSIANGNPDTWGSIGDASTTGTITYIADSMFGMATTITSGSVVIKPYTNTTAINIGTGSTGGLDLSSAMLDKISAGTITIGSNLNSGLITANAYDWNSDINIFGANDITIAGAQDTNNHSMVVETAGAGKLITVADAINVGSGDLTLSSDDLALTGNISGTGTLTLQPYDSTLGIGINAAGDYILDGSELTRLINGWNLINIGQLNGTGYMNTSTATFADPVVFRNTGYAGIGSTLTGTGDASFVFYGITELANGTITTNNQSVTFVNDLTASGGNINTNGGAVNINSLYTFYDNNTTTINSGNGDITIAGIVGVTGATSAGNSLVFNAGTGTVDFGDTVNTAAAITVTGSTITTNGAWGGTTLLGNISLTAASDITLPAITTAAGKTLTVRSADITLGGNLSAYDISLSGDAFSVGSYTVNAAHDLIVRNYTAGNTIGIGTLAAGTVNISDAFLDQIVWGDTLWLGGYGNYGTAGYSNDADLITLNTGTHTFNGNVTVGASGSAGIQLDNNMLTMASNKTLTLEANYIGEISPSYITTAGTGDIIIYTRTANYLGAGTTLQATGSGDILMNSDDEIQFNFNPVSLITNTGNITLNASGGILMVASNSLTSTSGDININGPLTITADQTINAGTGTVTFNDTVNGNYNMTVSGDLITLNGAWGNNSALADVSLTGVNGITLNSINANTILARTTGAGDITLANGTVLAAAGTGNSLVLASGRHFINNSNASALDASNGRWLVYSTDPLQDVDGGLLGSADPLYSMTYAGNPPGTIGAGNRFIYSSAEVIYVPPVNPLTPNTPELNQKQLFAPMADMDVKIANATENKNELFSVFTQDNTEAKQKSPAYSCLYTIVSFDGSGFTTRESCIQ